MEYAFATTDNHIATYNTEPTLESAYDSLLASREILYPTSVGAVSEEDTICNQNLQTSFLFKSLGDKSIKLNKEIETLVENEKSLEDAVVKFKNSHSILISLCKTYDIDSLTMIHTKYMELANEYSATQKTIWTQISTRRAALELELDTVGAKLNSIRKLIQQGLDDIIKPADREKKMCAVCYEREVCMVMVPCGHTYCDACSKYDYRAKCPQCRQTINSRVKMFFSM